MTDPKLKSPLDGAHFIRDLGVVVEVLPNGHHRATIPAHPFLCDPSGRTLTGVYATLVDIVAGVTALALADPNWVTTSDFDLAVRDEPLQAESEPLVALSKPIKVGKGQIVIDADVTRASATIAMATVAFSVLTRREDTPEYRVKHANIPVWFTAGQQRLDRPIWGKIGIQESAPGQIQVNQKSYIQNNLRVVQGGALAMIAEAACLSRMRAAGLATRVTDLHLRYLAPARIGPFVASAVWLGSTSQNTARIEIHDTGANNRLVALAKCRLG